MCNTDNGNWWGDCFSCQEGFFRQFSVGSCLDYCPTGSLKDLITKECSDPGLGAISSIVFNKLGVVYKGLPFGTYRLSPGDQLLHRAPVNTLDRGLFFNGNSGHVKIQGIILNTDFTVHFWVYLFEFTGDLLEIESETPTTDGGDSTMTCSCGGSTDNAEDPEVGINYNGDSNVVSASGKLPIRQWADFNLIAKFNLANQTTDISFCIGEFTLELTAAGNPFHHKKDTDIRFGSGIHAFVLNFKLFNQPIPKTDIEGLRFELEFPFERPVCTIG
jgi:hypothetical protein